MNVSHCIEALERSGETILSFCAALTSAEARWKPSPEKWSALEVLCHLADEERDDFRTRFRLTLLTPETDWPPIDPEGWARDRLYINRALTDTAADFSRERASSLAWLRSLEAPNLDRAHVHPQIGALRAGDLLAAWVAHDLLHLRQLVNLRLHRLGEASAPYSTRYAEP